MDWYKWRKEWKGTKKWELKNEISALLPYGVLFSLMKSNHFPHNITVTVFSLPPTAQACEDDNFKYSRIFYDSEFWLTQIMHLINKDNTLRDESGKFEEWILIFDDELMMHIIG